MNSQFFSHHRAGLFALFVVCCTLLAGYLRLDFYPDTYYGDEEIPIAVVSHMEKSQSLDTNWARGVWRKPEDRWAYGYDQYNFSSYNSTQYYLGQLFQVKKNNINPAVFNRICSVAFQTLALIIICYAINYLIGIYGAIAAGLFFVFNPLLVVDAHYARPESFLIVITTLAIVFHLLAIKKLHRNYFLLSAFMWGVAVACKFSVLPMAALCILTSLPQDTSRNKNIFNSAIWLLGFLTGAFLLAPYAFIHADKVAHGVLVLFKQYFSADSVSDVSFHRSDLLLPKYLLGYFGAAFWVAITLSLLHTDQWLKKLAMISLAVSIFYILIFSLVSFFNESNLSHLAFVWCLLIAIAVEASLARARKKTGHIHVFFIVITIAIVATPALCSFKIRTEVYNPAGVQKNQLAIEQMENTIIFTHPGHRMVDLSNQPALLNQAMEDHAVIKIPWMDRKEYIDIAQILASHHYELLDEILLPLHELPHSQLQSIHFPASYRYYQFRKPD